MPCRAVRSLSRHLLLAVGIIGCTGNIDKEGTPGPNGVTAKGTPIPGGAPGNGQPGGPASPSGAPGAASPGVGGPAGAGGAGPAATPGGPSAVACQAGALTATRLRRLTRQEYDSTVAVLLGDTTGLAKGFAPEGGSTGFDTAADGASLSDAIAEQYVEAARGLAKTAVKNMAGLLACDVVARGEDVCAKQFIGRFGRRAFRRPLAADEQTRYEGFYSASKTSQGFAVAMELLLRSLLTAPQFLYKVELGAGPGPKSDLLKLAPYEMATRLSYFFWGTMPDEDLMAAAEAGMLSTPAQVESQAKRLLVHANGSRVIRDFYVQWLGAQKLAKLNRGTAFTPSLAAAMKQETEEYFDRMVREKAVGWQELMQSPTTFVNADLATIYGLPGVTGTQFREVMRPADRHRGFLTQAAFLTLEAMPNDSSPIHRGKYIRTHVLCEPELMLPENIDPVIAPADATRTARQQLEAKTQMVQPCMACHNLLNPVGFAFDKFDHLGRFRDMDSRQRPYDTKGDLKGTDSDGAFMGHTDLIERLTRSEQVQSCMVTQWARYATAQLEVPADCGRQKELLDSFKKSGGNIRDLVIKLSTTEAFLYKGVSQ